MAASSCYQGKLRELAAIIKGTAKPLWFYELGEQYLLDIDNNKKQRGASLDPASRVKRKVKLEELGKMIKDL
jgi:hypothetical protein